MASLLHTIPTERILELVERLDVRGPRYTSYPTVPVWKTDPDAAARAFVEGIERLRGARTPIAVYVHVPFCRSRCLYCGCNSFISGREDRMRRYVDALALEIERVGAALAAEVPHEHLHLGGGTPTWLPASWLAELVDRLLDAFPAPGVGTERTSAEPPPVERSVEVDPRVTTEAHLELLADRGFRRLSIGVQDLDPDVQQAVRRVYSFDELARFIEQARALGFTGVNLDLIYGLPRQTVQSWQATLEAIARLGPDRLACFGYAHLPQRMAHQRAIPEQELPSPADRIRMLLGANRFFTEAGYEAIGLDHFARPEDELARARRDRRLWRNFMGYTTIRGLPLVGLGCSGISELEEAYTQNLVLPEAYADELEAGRSPQTRVHRLDADDRYRKQLLNHLLCNLELDLSDPPASVPASLVEELREAAHALGTYAEEGLIETTDHGFRVTALGQLFLRNLAMPFDRYLPAQTGTTFSRTV